MSEYNSPVPEDGASQKFASNWFKENPIEFVGGLLSAASLHGLLGWDGLWGIAEFGIFMLPGALFGAVVEAGVDAIVPKGFSFLVKIITLGLAAMCFFLFL